MVRGLFENVGPNEDCNSNLWRSVTGSEDMKVYDSLYKSSANFEVAGGVVTFSVRHSPELVLETLRDNETHHEVWDVLGGITKLCTLTKYSTGGDTRNNISASMFLDHFVNALSKKISIKDLGILYHFLGVEVIPTPTDSNWGGVNNAGRSTTAYILYLGTNIISWKSTLQKSVSRSSTEAKYYKALANASAELCWTKNLLHQLGIPTNHTPTLFCDNTSATYLCANPVYHSRMKHVALDYHFVREQVSAGQLRVLHISSQDQLADMLTKPLTRSPFLRNRSKIGVSNGSSILRGGRYKE
nr:uncharacterized mitochondrial protein AtMg00810-like [Tanacetum cinerariifolium]